MYKWPAPEKQSSRVTVIEYEGEWDSDHMHGIGREVAVKGTTQMVRYGKFSHGRRVDKANEADWLEMKHKYDS